MGESCLKGLKLLASRTPSVNSAQNRIVATVVCPTMKRFKIVPGLPKASVMEEHASPVWSLMNIYNKLYCFVFGFTWDFTPELHQHPRKRPCSSVVI